MAKYFSEYTNECLIGIRFNNNKEWFHQNKAMYKEYVHEPIVELANNLYEKFHSFDNEFIETPKVSRANRDIRFSKNKNPYKESKWFFLRGDGKIEIVYNKPTIVFEISPDCWRYGFFFGATPKGMAEYRKKIDANVGAFKSIIDLYNSQDIFELSGDKYKRIFNKELPDDINDWAQRKSLTFLRYEDYNNAKFYSEDLVDVIFDNLKIIYPIYKYFL